MKKLTYIILSLLVGIVIISCQKPHEHSYSETNVEPTCLEKGYTEYKCECGDSYKNNFIDEKGHSFGEWMVVKVATVDEEGLKERVCSCGEKETEMIAKLDHIHSFGDWVVVKVATEEETGLKERACTCGEIENEEIEKLEHVHNYVDNVCKCGSTLPMFLQITNQRVRIALDNDLALGVVVYPKNAENKDVIWTINDDTVASINSEGVLSPISTGKVSVTVTSVANPEVSNSITIEIVSDETLTDKIVEDLTIASFKESYLLHDALNVNLVKTFVPADASVKTVYWESSDEEVVAIYSNARTPYIVGVGTCTLTCYSAANPDVYFEIDVTIDEYVLPRSFEINNVMGAVVTEYLMDIGQSRQLLINVQPENADPRASYISTDETIAIVDENGIIKGVNYGTATIIVISKANPEFIKKVSVKVENVCSPEIHVEKVTLDGEIELFVGYKTKLNAKVYPEYNIQSVTLEVHKSSTGFATIDENGVVTALSAGIFRVRAVSSVDPTKKSQYLSILIKELPEKIEIGDMKGYEIVIMNDESELSNEDPFLESYNNPDKLAKQKAWLESETNYNCKIVVKGYPSIAPMGSNRVNWIIDNAINGTSQFDLGVVSTTYIPQFVDANACVDVSEIYGKYGMGQMEPSLKTAGSYKGKLYVASTGISQAKTYVDLGLYYNYGWIKELGVESPAKMFNEGRWTYSNFKNWVYDVQIKLLMLDDDSYELGGHPYNYWYGMTNAAGEIIANTDSCKINICSPESIYASNLIWKLVEAECVNTNVTWAENNDVASSFWKNEEGGTVMTTGYLSFIGNPNRWPEDMWGVGTTEFGYVPFPYPDDMLKEDTRIGLTTLSAYMYVTGRNYPSDLGYDAFKKVWYVMNEVFLNTIKYQEEDPQFDAYEIIEESLKTRISDPESITAIKFYNAKRVVYDPAYIAYGSNEASPLKDIVVNVLFKGYDYMEEFNRVFEQYENDFLKIYPNE